MGKKLHLLVVPAAAALVTLTSVPAQAAEGYDRCRPNYYCLFSGLDGTGDIVEVQSDTPDLAVLNMAGRAKSDWNRTSSTVHLYSEANYEGCRAVSLAGAKGNFFSTFRDFFHSLRVSGPSGPSCFTITRSSADVHG
ncbi:peptidase inhibitor family I36 protein [Nonomuraea sp. SYSU D8015]|uniref:peptidase inhibitor family I36 protein n=1 Tax=Nonomuraea sp. SYSU D8015 TaxID=2593644 RepID=UPI001660ABF1|nr:peptidase inhibitor family I36 protein [Nonomuraea sp. SYSU D8015]